MKGGEIVEEVGVCTESTGKWMDCFAFIKISQSILEIGDGISMHFVRVKGGAFDVDDLRYVKFLK